MPRQNRVTPFGEIIATSARGSFMGNRGGCMHNAQQQLTGRRWVSKRWIICRLEFKGRKREIMQPRCYTELFFWDEATALAAGHRPCRECRREDHERFKVAWQQGNPAAADSHNGNITAIDEQLHRERVRRDKLKVTFVGELASLPKGVFVTLPQQPEIALLIWDQKLFPWTLGGYGPPRDYPAASEVTVLTPASTVNALASGYVPVVNFIQSSE